MAGVNFKVDGLEKLQRIYKKLPKDLQRNVKVAIDVNAGLIRDAAKRDVPKDESRLANSISKKSQAGLAVDIIAQSDYAAYVEFGTKTKAKIPSGLEAVASQFRGKGKGGGDPLKAITGWVKRKGLAATFSTVVYNVSTRSGRRKRRTKAEAQRERTIAFLIWRHIKKYGIKAQPYFFKQPERFAPSIKKDVADAIERSLNAK